MSDAAKLPVPIQRSHRNPRTLSSFYNARNPATTDIYVEIIREGEITLAEDFENSPYPSADIPADLYSRELCYRLPILADVHGDRTALQQLFKILNDLRLRGATEEQMARQFNVTTPVIRKWLLQLQKLREKEIATLPITGVIADELDHLRQAREKMWGIINSNDPAISTSTKLKALSALPRITYGVVGVLKETGYLNRRPYLPEDDDSYSPAADARVLHEFQNELLSSEVIDVTAGE